MREFSEQGFSGSGSPHWRRYGSKNLGARRAPSDHARTPAGSAAARAHRLETGGGGTGQVGSATTGRGLQGRDAAQDRKSTRLNSSHVAISYAVFCLKKKRSHN